MIFDSHAHYDDEDFDNDRDEVLKRVKDCGVSYIVDAGSTIESSKKAVELSNKYDFIYSAVGIHPEEVSEFDADSLDKISELCRNDKVAAVGEIGLDYHYGSKNRDLQLKVFEEQIKLSIDLNLPVIVHDRDAHGDTFDLIRKYINKGLRGVLHCYSGSPEMAREYTDMGFYIGFTGVITFKNAKKPIEVLQSIPQDKILIETDCPYLAPEPFRGRRNDSSNLVYVIKKACEALNMEPGFFEDMTLNNAMKLFNIYSARENC